jgi:hypothetical protein
MASHRVAPSASAASRCERGTAINTSREMAAMYGNTMIARISPAASTLGPYAGPLKKGVAPRCRVSRRNGMMVERSSGSRKNTPHRPKTTLGTAASRSMKNDRGWRSQLGQNSERKIAPPSASGVATTRAMIEVTIVPRIAGAAPKSPLTGSHVLEVRKPNPNSRSAGQPARPTSTKISSSRTGTQRAKTRIVAR